MSFEGYFQLICKNGHYYHEGLYGKEELAPCPHCKSNAVWWNLVDITNECGNPIKVKLKKETSCNKCGSIIEKIFYIPKRGGHTV